MVYYFRCAYESIPNGFWTIVRMAGEKQLIERTGRKLPSRTSAGLRIGIGDDAAVVRPKEGVEWVLTTDAFLENIHFFYEVNSNASKVKSLSSFSYGGTLFN